MTMKCYSLIPIASPSQDPHKPLPYTIYYSTIVRYIKY